MKKKNSKILILKETRPNDITDKAIRITLNMNRISFFIPPLKFHFWHFDDFTFTVYETIHDMVDKHKQFEFSTKNKH